MEEFIQAMGALVGIAIFFVVVIGAVFLLVRLMETSEEWSRRRKAKFIKEQAQAKSATECARCAQAPLPKCLCAHFFNHHIEEGGHCAIRGCSCVKYMGPDPVLSGLWTKTTPLLKEEKP